MCQQTTGARRSSNLQVPQHANLKRAKSKLSSRRMFNSHNRVGKPMDLWHFTGFGPHLNVRSANLIRSNFRSSGALLLWDRRGSRQGSACYCHSYSNSFHGQKVNNDCVRMACVPAGYSYVLIHLTLSRLADSYMTCPSSNSFSCWCAECNSRCWEVFFVRRSMAYFSFCRNVMHD